MIMLNRAVDILVGWGYEGIAKAMNGGLVYRNQLILCPFFTCLHTHVPILPLLHLLSPLNPLFLTRPLD